MGEMMKKSVLLLLILIVTAIVPRAHAEVLPRQSDLAYMNSVMEYLGDDYGEIISTHFFELYNDGATNSRFTCSFYKNVNLHIFYEEGRTTYVATYLSSDDDPVDTIESIVYSAMLVNLNSMKVEDAMQVIDDLKKSSVPSHDYEGWRQECDIGIINDSRFEYELYSGGFSRLLVRPIGEFDYSDQADTTLVNTDGYGNTLRDIFPCKALAIYLRDVLGKFSIDQKVTQDELNDIRFLRFNENFADKLGIDNLAGIWRLKYLNELDASGTSITQIPEDISTLKYLTSIDISNTKIQYLPEALGDVNSLEMLNCSNTPLVALPENIGNCTNLKYLDITNTSVTELPSSLFKLLTLDLKYSDGFGIE